MTKRAAGDRVRTARRAGPEPPWDAADGDVAEQRQPADLQPEVDELNPDGLAPDDLGADGLGADRPGAGGFAADEPGAGGRGSWRGEGPRLPAEADPADAIEQQLAVPAEPDEYR